MPVLSDGNCLFTAAAFHLAEGGHKLTRTRVVEYLWFRDPKLAESVAATLDSGRTWASYLDTLARSRSWGGEECLIAMARLYRLRVIVVAPPQANMAEGQSMSMCFQVDGTTIRGLPESFQADDILLLYDSESHYDALIRGAEEDSSHSSPQKRQLSVGQEEETSPLKRSREVLFDHKLAKATVEELEQIFKTPRIGPGSYGDVFRGEWRGQIVAVKRLILDKLEGELKEEYLREVRVLKLLTGHAQIVKLLAATDPSDTQPCLIFEFAEGGSLYAALHEKRLPVDEQSVAIDIATGLAYLHSLQSSVWHRDLKSHNILLNQSRDHAKLCDFGMARIKETSSTTTMASRGGTTQWMAPEMMQLDTKYNSAADVYSFGCVLYEIVTKAVPWKGHGAIPITIAVSAGKRPPLTVPHVWNEMIEKCWAHDQTLRPTMRACLLALTQGDGKLLELKPASDNVATTSLRYLDSDLRHELYKRFQYPDFKQGQLEVIRQVLDRKNTLGVFATGAGKSLLYWLPSQLLPGLTVVVSPLLSSAADQLEKLTLLGISAGTLDGDTKRDAAQKTWSAIRDKQTKILFLSPEKFLNEAIHSHLKLLDVSLIVVDEVHCIWRWGPRFRPDYLRIRDALKKDFRQASFLGLTATATPAVVQHVCEQFSVSADLVKRGSFYRANLQLGYTQVFSEDERLTVLAKKLHESSPVLQ